jgi:hypothetical protein
MYRSVLACMASIVVSFSAASSAAKVVRLYNPWAAYGNALDGKIHLVNYWPMTGFGPDGTTNVFRQSGGGWLEYVFPTGLEPAAGVKFSVVVNAGTAPYNQSFGVDGLRGGEMDLGTALASSDTVWIAPNPLPSGSAKVFVARPREMTVLLWNPFEADTRAQRPAMKAEGGGFGLMDSVPGAKGWYALRTIGFTNLNLQFRNADSSKVVGATGLGSSLPANFDSLVSRNDTIWVWTSADPHRDALQSLGRAPALPASPHRLRRRRTSHAVQHVLLRMVLVPVHRSRSLGPLHERPHRTDLRRHGLGRHGSNRPLRRPAPG